MRIFKKLRQIFCFHNWLPIKLIYTYYNDLNCRYAKCFAICRKCKKVDYKSFLMATEFQDKLNSIDNK